MAIERWIAAASLGLFIMFAAQMISLSDFLKHPERDVDPSSLVREFLSISGVPALILAGSSFALARRYGSRLCGSLIIAGGVVTLVGMYYVNSLIPDMSPAYVVPELTTAPTIFMAISIPVMVIGGLLFRVKTMPKRDYFFDR